MVQQWLNLKVYSDIHVYLRTVSLCEFTDLAVISEVNIFRHTISSESRRISIDRLKMDLSEIARPLNFGRTIYE